MCLLELIDVTMVQQSSCTLWYASTAKNSRPIGSRRHDLFLVAKTCSILRPSKATKVSFDSNFCQRNFRHRRWRFFHIERPICRLSNTLNASEALQDECSIVCLGFSLDFDVIMNLNHGSHNPKFCKVLY